MARLTTDLLDLAKLEAGQPLPINPKKHDALELIREAAELLEPLASAKQLTLTADSAAPVHVFCDGHRVQQTLSNLIGNAIKFTPEGGTIQITAQKTEREVVVSVSDTGAGIPDDTVPHIFKPYWQADAQGKGAGLGLAIVKAVVDAHGGRVWVETAPGIGSIFFFTLPAAG